MRFRPVLLGLAAVSLLANFATQWRQPHVVQFTSEATRVSLSLLNGKGFSDPLLTGPSGPTALMAPLYPVLYAAICWLFGTAAGGWAAIVAITALVWAVQWAFVYRFAALWGHPGPGLAAALLGVALPLPGRLFKWEAAFAGAALATSAWVVSRIIMRKESRWTAPAAGLLFAADALLCPPAVLMWAPWTWLVAKRIGTLRTLKIGAVALAVAAVPIGLWTARNYAVFHHLFFIRDAAGVALVSSNNDCATPIISENIASGCFAANFPTGSETTMKELRAKGEYEYGNAEMKRTMAWVRSHPGRFAALSAERIAYFWFPIERTDSITFAYGVLMSAFSLLSLLSLLWIRSDGFRIVIGGLATFPLIYYIAQEEQRYRYPILWMSMFLACVGIHLALKKFGPARKEISQ
jgi:hypothetical protein